jgi:hypothetical protein
MSADKDQQSKLAVGGTGGPAATPKSGKSIGQTATILHRPGDQQSYEQFRAQLNDEAVAIMHSGTGGIGSIPETLEAVKAKNLTPRDFLEEIRTGGFKALSLDDKFNKIIETNIGFKPIFAAAQRQIGIVALTIGEMATITQIQTCAEKGGLKGWTRYRMERLDPHIHPSTLRGYMSAASLNDAVEHLEIGIDRLVRIASIVKDCHLEKDPKPIATVLQLLGDNIDVNSDMPMDAFKTNCDAAIYRHRLNREGLEIPFQTLQTVCGAGIKIETADIDEMKYRKSAGKEPVEYLLELINEPENRNDLLTYKQPGSKKGSSKPRAQLPKDINVAVQILKDTVIHIINLDSYETPVETDRIDALIAQLEILKKKEVQKRQAKQQAA